MSEKHDIALIPLDAERRRKFREANSPTDYAHNSNREMSLFELLNIFCDCDELVKKCKALVSYRNTRLGHVNYLLVSEDSFWNKIKEYDDAAIEIHALTETELTKLSDLFITNFDHTVLMTADDVETGLIIPQRLSEKDLFFINSLLFKRGDFFSVELYKILYNNFAIIVE